MSEENNEIECARITLSTGKIVLIRVLQIKHMEQAEQLAGAIAGMKFIKEMIKLLVVKIDDKMIKPAQLENLDALFSIKEYMEVTQVVGNFIGAETKAPQVETVFGIR